MRSSNRSAFLVTSLACFLATGSASAASPPTTGLGQTWPDSPDVSLSPRYHVYVFERLGVKYVQVNDLTGSVRGAFGNAGGDLFGLPIGRDADRLSTPSEPLATPSGTTGTGETIFQDDSTSLEAVPREDGTLGLRVRCDNPAKCSIQGP